VLRFHQVVPEQLRRLKIPEFCSLDLNIFFEEVELSDGDAAITFVILVASRPSSYRLPKFMKYDLSPRR
jgi:hypothetical protein